MNACTLTKKMHRRFQKSFDSLNEKPDNILINVELLCKDVGFLLSRKIVIRYLYSVLCNYPNRSTCTVT